MRQALTLRAIATLLVLLVGFVSRPASAENAPMSFSIYYGRGEEARDCRQSEGRSFDCSIIARGIIKTDTAKRFRDFLTKLGLNESTGLSVTVLLDSEGGDVSNALEMGRLIRSYRMNTELVRVEGSRQVCPGTSDYALFRAKDHNFAPSNCYDVLYSEQPANCKSACTLVFMAGIHRSLESNSLFVFLNGRPDERLKWISDYGDIPDAQSQLGFHPVQPSANPNVPKEVRKEVLKFGAVWGQQESAKVLSYMEAMGVDNDALSFFTGDGAARVGPDGYYYPSVTKLQQVGILAGSNFGPFNLKVVAKSSAKPGLALVSNRPTWNADGTQLSLFCRQTGAHAGQLFAMISLPRVWKQPESVPPVISVEAIEFVDLEKEAANGMRVVRPTPLSSIPADAYGWRMTLNVDGKILLDLGQIEPSNAENEWKKIGYPEDSAALQAVSFVANSSDVFARHFAAVINSNVLSSIVSGQTLEIGFAASIRQNVIPLKKISMDDDFRSRLSLLPGNCVP